MYEASLHNSNTKMVSSSLKRYEPESLLQYHVSSRQLSKSHLQCSTVTFLSYHSETSVKQRWSVMRSNSRIKCIFVSYCAAAERTANHVMTPSPNSIVFQKYAQKKASNSEVCEKQGGGKCPQRMCFLCYFPSLDRIARANCPKGPRKIQGCVLASLCLIYRHQTSVSMV